MKEHQAELKMEFPVDVKTIKSFPAYWCYELNISYDISRRLSLGGLIGYTSTGGRMHYRDYSGELECNQTTRAFNFGLHGEVILNFNRDIPIGITWNTGFILSQYDLDVALKLGSDKDSDRVGFKSNNFFIEPGLIMRKKIVNSLFATLKGSYNFNALRGGLKLKENEDYELEDNSGNRITLDWSGLRVTTGITFVLGE